MMPTILSSISATNDDTPRSQRLTEVGKSALDKLTRMLDMEFEEETSDHT